MIKAKYLLSFILICFFFVSTNAQSLNHQSSYNSLSLTFAPPAQPQTGATEKDATVFGQKIHYTEAGGSGPVVVLLHGLGGSSRNWAFNIAPLSQQFRVIALDQIGFGKSDKPLVSYRVSMYVDFLDAFLAQLKIEKASIVGVSLGGWVAASYAVTYPNRVEKLVLVDSAGFAPSKDFALNNLQDLNPTTRASVRQVLSLTVHNKALFSSDAAVDAILTQRLTAGDGFTIQSLIESVNRGEDFLDGKLSAIKQPTLIVWGKQDLLTPLNVGERFKREIQNSQLVIIDQCGHAPNVEKAADFNNALLKFLPTGPAQ